MPPSPAYRPDPRWPSLGEGFADPVPPARFPKRVLRFRNDRAAAEVGLETLDDAEWEAAFARFEPLFENLQNPLALRYHGHQFQAYNPYLGDGRGFLFAQLRDGRGRLLDLGTKGSGTTPWSRGGDGRLTLKGGVREILATELLEAHGVDTSRTFSLFETGEELWRGDEPSPTRSSVLVRLSHSHVRFGTFQRLAAQRDRVGMRRLLDYVIAHFHPSAVGPRDVLALVAAAHGRTVGRWMVAGFVHGVLNTDNMNITGESFDYGPWRFAPAADPEYTAAYFDGEGLYAYGRQPVAVAWNLDQLARALELLGEPLEGATAAYRPAIFEGMRTGLLRRLGLRTGGEAADTALVQAWFAFAEASRAPLDQLYQDAWGGRLGGAATTSPNQGWYRGERFAELLEILEGFEPAPHAADPLPALPDGAPIGLHIDTVEALWDTIARKDDWGPLQAHVAAIRRLGAALAWEP